MHIEAVERLSNNGDFSQGPCSKEDISIYDAIKDLRALVDSRLFYTYSSHVLHTTHMIYIKLSVKGQQLET